jgi:hypothetical protein
VVQDHLGVLGILAFGILAEFDQVAGVEPGIGVAFKAARRPRQVDQQALKDGSPMSPGRPFEFAGVPDASQMSPGNFAQIPGFIGYVLDFRG